MLPKTELRYSWLYNSIYDKNFKEKDILRLKNKCSTFEKLYDRHIKEILRLIEKYFYKWEQENIVIYIIGKGPVFWDPLTIRHEDAKIMLIRLIHELMHNNISHKKFKNAYLMHLYMDKKMKKILDELSFDLHGHFYICERMTEKFRKREK